MSDLDRVIEEHWSPAAQRGGLLSRILEGLAASGADLAHLTSEDLAPVDEFHIRGREATLELASYADVERGAHVLDVGSGLGGPSRVLARDYGCRVTGIDLTREYCDAAGDLARRVGLADLLSYRQASALELPFEDSSFSMAWTQHVSMNIADKARFFGEIHRVLQPGGRLALYDPIAGSGDPIHLPVPWAREVALNHLVDVEATRHHLAAAGFSILKERDVVAPAIEWFRANLVRAEQSGPRPLGFHLLLGPDWQQMANNLLRNLEEGRVSVVQMVVSRPR